MKSLFKTALFLSALAFAAALQANDLLKALDTIEKVVDGTSAPSVSGVVVATGFASGVPSGVATTFPPASKKLYACYTSAGAVGSSKLQAAWYYEQNGAMAKIASSVDAMAKSGSTGEFHLEVPSGKWPVGNYKVELSLNEKILGSAAFKVEEASAASGSGAVWGGASAGATSSGSSWSGGSSQAK